MNKLLLDTNILLDAAMGERPEWAYATLLMDEFAYGGAQGFIAASSLKDVYYVLTKYASEADARKYIQALLELFEIVPVDRAVCSVAAASNEPDFEDGVVRACAEAAGVDVIISRDAAAFAKSTIKRMSAKEYTQAFCNIQEVQL